MSGNFSTLCIQSSFKVMSAVTDIDMISMNFPMLLEQLQGRKEKLSLDQRIQTYSEQTKKKTQMASLKKNKKTITMLGVNCYLLMKSRRQHSRIICA